MVVQLSGYESAFDGVYVSFGFVSPPAGISIKMRDGKDVDLRSVVLPARYVEPIQSEVVAYLRRKAGDVRGAASIYVPGGTVRTDKTPLERMLMRLPQTIRDGIADGSMLPDLTLENGDRINQLEILFGLIPENILQESRKAGEAVDIDWYKEILAAPALRDVALGMQWKLGITTSGWSLPKKGLMDVLVDDQVVRSRTLDYNGSRRSYYYVKGVIDSLYEGLPTEQEVLSLPDISDWRLEVSAMAPLIKLTEDMRMARMEAAMKGEISGGGNPMRDIRRE